MDFYDVIEKRHSSRSFLNKDIEKKKLERILDAMSAAPSAGNLQSYKVYLLKKKEDKKKLAAAALDQDFIADAPVVLVFCADTKRSALRYGERGESLYCMQDATIAAAYAQLAAAAEGLSTVWVGAFDPFEAAQIIKVEPYDIIISILPIGYPAEKPEKTSRRPLKELTREVK